jgi:ribosome-binding factor A
VAAAVLPTTSSSALTQRMSIRTARVAEEIQKVLGERLVRGLRDPLPGFVTIRSVEVTSDFAHAKVFVSVFGSDEQKQGAIEGLRAQRGFLRKEIGSKVRLRLTPELTFVLDESGERAARVHALLDAVKDGKPAPHIDDEVVTPKKKKPRPVSKKPAKRAGADDDDKDDADDVPGGEEV